MTTRIGTYGATQGYINQLMAIQARMQTEQSQVSTKLISTDYSGIAKDAASVLNLSNQMSAAQQFISDNDVATTKLNAAQSAIDSISTTIHNFNNSLNTFIQGNTKDPASIALLQKSAFQGLMDMQGYLGTNIGGDYVFSGGRISTNPVDFGATSLDAFQKLYDGSASTYPLTRAADLADINLDSGATGPLTFNQTAGTVTAANAGAFSKVPVGATITLGGVSPPAKVTVSGVNASGTIITVASPSMTAETAANANVSYGATNLNNTSLGTLGFQIGTGTGINYITPSQSGSLSALKAGSVFTVSGTQYNDGTYTVVSNNGSTLAVTNNKLNLVTPTSGDTAATLTDGTSATTNSTGGAGAGYGSLSFGADSNGQLTLTASTPNAFNGGAVYPTGTTLTVTGSSPNGANDGQYTVLSNDGTTVTMTRKPPMPATVAPMVDIYPQLSAPGVQIKSTSASAGLGSGFGNLTFSSASGALTVSSDATNGLSGITNGGTLTIAGSRPLNTAGAGVNDGTFVVTSLNAANTKMTLAYTSVSLTDTTTAATITSAAGGGGAGGYGNLVVGANASGQMTLTAATAATFNTVNVGDTYTVTGTIPNGANDGTFIVAGKTGTVLTLATTPSSFQTGIAPTVNETAASLSDLTTAAPAITNTTGGGGSGYGALTIATNSAGHMTITTSTANALGGVSSGDTVKVTGASNAANNGTYYVLSKTGSTLELSSSPPTVTATSWYKGDTLNIEQRVDVNRSVDVGIYASDPAFEKAIRAMAMIAQGAPNTAGGLAANQNRIQAASYLLKAAIDNPGVGTPPSPLTGVEDSSNISSLGSSIGYTAATIKTKTDNETSLVGFIQTRIANMTTKDPTEAITQLLSDSNSMQASYQSLAKIFDLSLLNYIK